MRSKTDPANRLAAFARQYSAGDVSVREVRVFLDESQDGEPVARVLLLLPDPKQDTWPVEPIRQLRSTIAREATKLGLPPISLTLVAEGEREAAEAFKQ